MPAKEEEASAMRTPEMPEIHPQHRAVTLGDLRVPMTAISLAESPGGAPNDDVLVYRTCGPGSDPRSGLPALRADWINARDDVETYRGRGRHLADDGRTAVRRGEASSDWLGPRREPLRSRNGKSVTQMHYARRG
jgi:phosphomethylpyrimidine synthase